ncbi:MAG TPA: nuclear transport factor 2 family protein [Solirubrobacterales bacterium]|nr:nuclear transport factor 2 family protein [Solirubrobacterales bacterium]
MTTATDAQTGIRALAERYGEAWNCQDLDAIIDLHTDDSVFVAHAAGSVPAEGRAAVREAFAGYLALLPDINFAERALHVGQDHWVLESTMSGTVAGSIEVEGVDPAAKFVAAEDVEDGARVEVDCVDVIEVRDGLVASKQTYIDSLAMQRQLGGE